MIGWLVVFALVEVEAQSFVSTGKVKEYLATLRGPARDFSPGDRIPLRPRIEPNEKGNKVNERIPNDSLLYFID